MENIVPTWLKRTTMTVGLILTILGIPFALNGLCIVPVVLLNGMGSEPAQFGIISLTLMLLTMGAGITAYWHGNRSLKNQPSRPLQFPSPIALIAIFIPLLLLGLIMQVSSTGLILFISILLGAAILPPLWAVAWMLPQFASPKISSHTTSEAAEQDTANIPRPTLTWRRGLLAFTGGATISVLIAIVLEILLPVIILSLVFNLADSVTSSGRSLLRALANTQVAEAIANPGFLFIFLQLAIIAPVAEEIAKPLVTLPLLRNLSRQESFWIGALAGAGFAALENMIYSTIGISVWAGILIVRALGSALHPLGSGLVAVGWRDVLNKEKDAGANWWRRFGIAVAIHAAWNGGSLLVITLESAGFFGELPPNLDVLGVSAAGITLAFLLVLGIGALWIGRAYGHDRPFLAEVMHAQAQNEFSPSDRTAAIWALACLIAIVPIGIAGLKLWLR